MQQLFEIFNNQLGNLETTFRRDIIDEIDWNDRLIGIKGARGVGKTTVLFQHIKENYRNTGKCLYISLDNLYFTSHTMYSLAGEFYKNGGEVLFIDEIHKYHNWSQELKNIYDSYRKLKVVFTGSSLLHIEKGNADLSRRAVVYNMEGLSFREFIQVETGKKFPALKLEQIFNNHVEIASGIISKIKPIKFFNEYLKHGYYPFYLESKTSYSQKLLATVNLALENEISLLKDVDHRHVMKLKKLLYLISTSVPFQPNISKLSESIEVSRPTVMSYLDYLKEAKIINLLRGKASGYAIIARPEKIFMQNTNLMYSLASENVDKGNLRETFLLSQLCKVKVVASPISDFLVNDKFTIEVGGRSKSNSQLKGTKQAFVAADSIETGYQNMIPLWMFGMLY